MNAEQLNANFGIDGKVMFVEGKGGFAKAEVHTPFSKALISTYAGQVLSFTANHSAEDLLFISEHAYFHPGKAIKGGVPICWPWFGPDPEDKGRPGHGFVRNRQWQVEGVEAKTDGSVQIILGMEHSHETKALWPFAFHLKLIITVGQSLTLGLATQNLGEVGLTISQGLHTYFRVGDISKTKVSGLAGKTYLDKTDGGAEKVQDGLIIIDQEVDRIYTEVDGELTIEDEALNRKIRITSQGSKSAVVWNPWKEKAQAMKDFGDNEYTEMLCVETTNAGPDTVTVPAQGEYLMQATYTLL